MNLNDFEKDNQETVDLHYKIHSLEEKLAESEKKNAKLLETSKIITEAFAEEMDKALKVIKAAADFLGQNTVTEEMAHECHYVLMNFLAKHEIKGSENEKRD